MWSGCIIYNKLSKLYPDLSRDMFVVRVISDFNSSESSLEETRLILFNSLKETDDFPFDADIELFTRRGDPVSVKLSHDIYTNISTLEGEDYASLNDVISVSRRKLNPCRSQCHESATASPNYQLSQEIAMLKDTVASLQSDVLLVQQQLLACE